MDALNIYSPSLDLVVLLIAVVIELVLAYVVFWSNKSSATSRIFALLSVVTVLWMTDTYIVRQPGLLSQTLVLHRLGIFFAAPMSLLFFLLAHTIPSDTLRMKISTFRALVAATVGMMLLNISPYAFTGIKISGEVSQPIAGPGLAPFSILSTVFSVLAVYLLVRRYLSSKDAERTQTALVLSGMMIMLLLITVTILIPILVFNSADFLAFAPLYALIFLSLTAYAITKYELFSIKVLVTQALTIVISIVLFAKIFGEESRAAQVLDVLVFVFVIVSGYFLVRSVRAEVEARQMVERLSEEKSEFMTFASHEIRNPITAMRGFASLIVDGTTGAVSKDTRDAAQKILVSGHDVLNIISTYLSKSKMELGQISYDKTEFDLGDAIASVAEGYVPNAEIKGLTLDIEVDRTHQFKMVGDQSKVKEVFGNLIDNSLKYTKRGSITVTVERHGPFVRAVVTDTGVGIPKETLGKLFQKFSRADAHKVNLLGTGVGLYLGKIFIEAQGGRIWAESDGEGHGSRFIIEFPAA